MSGHLSAATEVASLEPEFGLHRGLNTRPQPCPSNWQDPDLTQSLIIVAAQPTEPWFVGSCLDRTRDREQEMLCKTSALGCGENQDQETVFAFVNSYL